MRINLTYEQVCKLLGNTSYQIDLELSLPESIFFIKDYMPTFENWMRNNFSIRENMPTIEVSCTDVVNMKLTPISYDDDHSGKVLVKLMLYNRYWTKDENKIIFN